MLNTSNRRGEDRFALARSLPDPTPPRLQLLDRREVTRSTLIERLLATDARLAVLWAPAGFGKTTLARQFAAASGHRLAWFALDASDDDPDVLSGRLVRELASAAPVPHARAAASGCGVGDAPAIMQALEDDLSRVQGPAVVVLDDLDRVRSDAALAVLARFLDIVPASFHVVILSREKPPLHLARRSLDASTLVLDQDDLRMTPEESVILLRRRGVQVADEVLESVVETCDGWPAALVFAVMSLGASETDPAPASLAGMNERLAEYLDDELLAALPPGDRDFLLRTSVLETLTADLCDVVCDRHDSAATLLRLSASGVLTLGLDDPDGSFRATGLMRELLRLRLHRTGAACEPTLRRRAAAWYRQEGRTDDAIHQLILAGDRDDAASLVYCELMRCIGVVGPATVARWSARFTYEECFGRPDLALVAGWAALVTGEPDQVQRWYEHAGYFEPATALPDGTTLDIGRAALRVLAGIGGTTGIIEAAGLICTRGSQSGQWWPMARLQETFARCIRDELEDPIAAFAAVEFETRPTPMVNAAALGHLAWLSLRRHDDASGHDYARRALSAVEDAGLSGHFFTAGIHAAVALDSASRGMNDQRAEHVGRALTLLGSAGALMPKNQTSCDLILAESALRAGEIAESEAHLARARAKLASDPEVLLQHAWVDDIASRIGRRRRATRTAVPDLTQAEMRVLEQLPSCRSLHEIAASLCVSRNTVKSHTLAIYRKLAVSGRSKAVERATDLGLLDDQGLPLDKFSPSGGGREHHRV